jgi:hypothetical protein
MPTTIVSQLRSKQTSCNEILNAGSIVLVGMLEDCEAEPKIHTLNPSATIAVGDTTAFLQSDQIEGTWLREGSVLHFGSASIVVASSTLVTQLAAVAVPIEPATATVGTSVTAETWALLKLLSPTNIPLNLESEMVDRTDLNSIQGANVKTSVNFKPQIQAIASLKDRALWTVIFQGAKTTLNCYANIIYSSTQNALGRALISGYSTDGGNKEIVRPQFTLEFQGEDYEVTMPWKYEPAANQTVINDAMKLSGMSVYS